MSKLIYPRVIICIIMKMQKKLLVGVLLFVLTLAFSLPLRTGIAYAATSNSRAQLNSLANSLKLGNDCKLTGKLGGETIAFELKTVANGFTTIKYYEATNLDCNGEKARVVRPNAVVGGINGVQDQINLVAKFKQGSGCSEQQVIKSSISTDSFAAATQASPTDDEEAGNNISCETTDSGPLGWILCPVIELAASFTEFVFEKFVQPFLEDVPVTTDETDGSYQAWKSFRLIGNIVLVGTMIAVVYAQVRGDR